MSAQRLRRWPNIRAMSRVYWLDVEPMLFECWPAVYDAVSTFKQHWVSA